MTVMNVNISGESADGVEEVSVPIEDLSLPQGPQLRIVDPPPRLGRRGAARNHGINWDAEPRLGQMTDFDLGQLLGCTESAVSQARRARGIPAFVTQTEAQRKAAAGRKGRDTPGPRRVYAKAAARREAELLLADYRMRVKGAQAGVLDPIEWRDPTIDAKLNRPWHPPRVHMIGADGGGLCASPGKLVLTDHGGSVTCVHCQKWMFEGGRPRTKAERWEHRRARRKKAMEEE